MSYYSRIYRQRNPQKNDDSLNQPFFSKRIADRSEGQKPAFFQAKLAVNEPGDKYEKEADSVANAVVNQTSQKSLIQQKHDLPEKEKKEGLQKKEESMNDEEKKKKITPVQAKQDVSSSVAPSHVTSKIENAAGKGNPLPKRTLNEMSSSFGTDFSGVRVHHDAEAANLNQELQAQAFTHGGDIYFNKGKYNPENNEGKFLLAHELTHVVQQGALASAQNEHGESIQTQPAGSGSSLPVGAGTSVCGKPSHCPPAFCSPFPAKFLAEQARNSMSAGLLAGIAAFVSPRVVPLWNQYLAGGAAPQDLSKTFGADFTASSTTKDATINLMSVLKAELTSSPPVFPAGVPVVTLSLASLIPSAIADLDTTGSGSEMNFNVIGEIPGNIAGGIGKTQLSCPVGALPSPFDDSRSADGIVTVIKNPGGDLTVIPSIIFSVKDTIDLCPGDCGAPKEQVATIPMSMMEASGVAGDVPFNVDFPAPATEAAPFNIPAPAPKPPAPAPRLSSKARVGAKPFLRIRESANTSSRILGNYKDGKEITILCVTDGEDILGNKKWGKTDQGFVSDFYLNHLDSNKPPNC